VVALNWPKIGNRDVNRRNRVSSFIFWPTHDGAFISRIVDARVYVVHESCNPGIETDDHRFYPSRYRTQAMRSREA
jgi:hypothetical protein